MILIALAVLVVAAADFCLAVLVGRILAGPDRFDP